MKLLELTLESPADNLALDEALLEAAEAGDPDGEVLRLWESPGYVAVLGRSSDIEREVNLAACQQLGIPVLRRASGGATVLIGPGCLMYAVVLSYQRYPQLRMLATAHRFVLERLSEAVAAQVPEIELAGTSDLSLKTHKFSGNSLRCRQRYLLYHGTIVYDFATDLISQCLGTPARQPDYRQGRAHHEFVANVQLDPVALRRDLRRAWGAEKHLETWPSKRTAKVAAERYSQPHWNVGADASR